MKTVLHKILLTREIIKVCVFTIGIFFLHTTLKSLPFATCYDTLINILSENFQISHYLLYYKLLFLIKIFDLPVNSTQIYVASEDNVKYEVSGVSGVQQPADPLTNAQTNQQQTQQQQKTCEYTYLHNRTMIANLFKILFTVCVTNFNC